MKNIIQLILSLLVTCTAYSQLYEGFEGAPQYPTNEQWVLDSGTWYVYENTSYMANNWMKNETSNPYQSAHTGADAAYVNRQNVGSGTAQDWLVTPAVNLSNFTNPQLKFYSKLTINGDQGSIYKILLINANGTLSDLNSYTVLSTWSELEINPAQQDYQEITVNIPTNSAAGQNVRIAFLMEGDNADRWLVDDVFVGSGCLGATGLTANSITTNSANLAWDNAGQVTGYEIEIVKFGEPFIGQGIQIPQNSYTATQTTNSVPFEEGTEYRFKVKANCGTGNYSQWSPTYSFNTLYQGEGCGGAIAIPTTLPYIKVNQAYTVSNLAVGAGAGCGSGSADYLSGNYKIYSYSPTATETINIKMSSTVNQTAVFVYDGCEDIGANCYASAFDEAVTDKEINNLQVITGHTYYIVVATTAPIGSRFSLLVNKNNCPGTIIADFDIQGDCVSSNFNAVANISSLGSGTATVTATLYYETGTANPTVQTVTAPGTISFPATGNVRILLQSSNNGNCNLLSKNLSLELCPPSNDECANATVLTSSANGECYPVKGKVTGATASAEPSTCAGNEDDDVWYEFVASSSEHIIEISNVNGTDTNLSHVLYEGATCSTMAQIYCSSSNYSVATNLVVGQTYKIRVYSVSSDTAETTFTICTRSYPDTCMDNNQYSLYIRQSFVALINHLIGAADTIDTSVSPYTCPELSALAPYITDANPKIYNFSYAGGMLRFSFSNHSPSDPDVLFYMPVDTYMASMNLISYDPATTVGLAGLKFVNGEYMNVRNNIRHVNFCPEGLSTGEECESVAGRIRINPGISCMNVNTPHNFTFITDTSDIVSYSWAVYNYSYEVLATSQQANPSFTFGVEDSYLVRLIVTDSNGCKTLFEKLFSVSSNCSDFCTEVNPASDQVKILFMDLVNHLLDIYREGGTVATPYSCPEMTALAPYVTDSNAKVYGISYVNGALKFSFASHLNDYDISIKDNGQVTDIDLLGYFDPTLNGAPATSYLNGSKVYSNRIKHVNFCPSVCPELEGQILVNNSSSNDLLFAGIQSYSFATTNTTITSYSWTFYSGQNGSILTTSSQPNPVVDYTGVEDYCTVQLDIVYGDGCTERFYSYVTIVPGLQTIEGTCWFNNSQYPVVTEAYLNLVNHLIDIYENGGNVPNPYICDELDILAPYIMVDNPKIWNVSVEGTTLQFSFSNITEPDVIINYFAHIADITVYPGDYNSSAGSFEAGGNFESYMPGGTPAFANNYIKRINFCPEFEGEGCEGNAFGHIVQSSGVSCTVLNSPQTFSFLTGMNDIIGYNWTFYNSEGTFPVLVSQSSNPTITYSTLGNYLVKLEVTNANGCKSYFYKTVTVAGSCAESCTEVNENSTSVKFLYISLLNHLLNLNGIIPEGYTCMELSALSPYLSDSSPGIYNVSFNGQQLSFSFSQGATQPDVVINDLGAIDDINIFNYTSTTSNASLLVTYSNGNQSAHTVKHVDFCPVIEPCESHVAFVIDESSSMSDAEVVAIKRQLNAFIDQQEGSNMTISFVGMSDSDFNTRTDHVYGRVTAENKILFKNWISKYRSAYTDARLNMGISPDSDYWASGLNHAMSAFALKPEIVIVLTDGSQTDNVEGLKNAVTNITNDPDSHLYVYGGSGYYVNQNFLDFNANTSDTGISDVTGMLKTSLKFVMELPDAEYPISSTESLIAASYYEYEDFSTLEEDLTYFSEKLSSANIGCGLFTVEYCKECETFQPAPGGKYWISAWVKEEQNIQVKTYTKGLLKLIFEDGDEQEVGNIELLPTGDIIDGWQRIAAKFEIPSLAQVMKIELINLSPNIPVYFDDIRVHPLNASMKSYVYDPETFRLMAELDDNNYSTYYEYDNEGGLVRIKKETSKGVKTIQETRSGNVIQPTN